MKSRLLLKSADKSFDKLVTMFQRRIIASSFGLCPIDVLRAFLSTYHSQSCGKCTPCRIGIGQISFLLDDILDGKGNEDTIKLIEKTANVVATASDCEIGTNSGELVLFALKEFREDFLSHIKNNHCSNQTREAVPCKIACPANVDVPGYIALVGKKKYKDAIRLIRKDNPFPVTCSYICNHPCESYCRRSVVDDAINIKGIKNVASIKAGFVEPETPASDTGKSVAIVGGGPSGLTACYYLRLMGHKVSVFERNSQLGGMLYYGIPRYRLPAAQLKRDIDNILALGVDLHLKERIGRNFTIDTLRKNYDAIYIAIGAQVDKKASVEGEDAENVISAVEFLHIAAGLKAESLEGKKVIIIGGGNVAMDCARTCVRLNAERVSVVYRRRRQDMTASLVEVEAAIAEGVEILDLMAQKKIIKNESNKAVALVAQPNMVSSIGKDGRPTTTPSDHGEVQIPGDLIIFAIGQGIDSAHFEEAGLAIERKNFKTDRSARVLNSDGVFAGGDCVTGPSLAIEAIAAGKVAAANIDSYLGFNHEISCDVKIPDTEFSDVIPCGRINIRERLAHDAKNDFEQVEIPMSEKEAEQEISRCLRCDCFGFGILKNGRENKW